MNKRLKVLIKKLGKKYPNYDFATQNFHQPTKVEKMIDGVEVVDITYEVVVQLTVFTDPVAADGPKILKKVHGMGIGSTRAKAVENAEINCINLLGVF